MKISKIKLLLLPLTLLMVAVWNQSVQAACPDVGNENHTVTFGSAIVQRDAPVGTVIATWTETLSGRTVVYNATCTVSYLMQYGSYNGTYNGTQYYNTNLQGVGIAGDNQYYKFTNPPFNYTGTGRWPDAGVVTFTLIKTGPINSGYLTDKSIGVKYFGSIASGSVITWNLSNSSVTQVACSISTPNINVPLDDVLSANLTAIGVTAKPRNFNVGLQCDAGARVNAKLIGTQNTDSSAAGVLQLTGAGSAGVAKGVGVQILYNGTAMTLNNNVVLKTSAGGLETFPFTAQYYQTKSAVTTGSANATATLELTYQ